MLQAVCAAERRGKMGLGGELPSPRMLGYVQWPHSRPASEQRSSLPELPPLASVPAHWSHFVSTVIGGGSFVPLISTACPTR